jgi:cyclin-dependent kinase 8/11
MAVLKSLVFQLLNGVHYLHCQHVLHRDLKPANVLVDNGGNVKIGDLGLARIVRGPLASLYTGDRVVVTIWYRAPELLLGARHYGRPIDVWAVGCVLAELAGLRPLFKGDEAKADPKRGAPFQRDQLAKIADVLGPPDEVSWPGLRDMPDYATFRRTDPPAAGTGSRLAEWCVNKGLRTRDSGPQPAYDILKAMLTYDPAKRVTAETALKHEWFKHEPLPTAK